MTAKFMASDFRQTPGPEVEVTASAPAKAAPIEVGNPYELASYLSAKYHVYFREQVQDELREIFEAQYELTLTEEVEIRYRTETSTDPETGETTTEEVPYEYYILNVILTNKTLPAVILPRLNEQQITWKTT